MDSKPAAMNIKDYLIRLLAVKILTSEKTIDAVITHQFQSANEALDLNNSVEISGFGKICNRFTVSCCTVADYHIQNSNFCTLQVSSIFTTNHTEHYCVVSGLLIEQRDDNNKWNIINQLMTFLKF